MHVSSTIFPERFTDIISGTVLLETCVSKCSKEKSKFSSSGSVSLKIFRY